MVAENNWAPPKGDGFKYYVTNQAVTQYREYLSNDRCSKMDGEIARLLDDEVFRAFSRSDHTKVVDKLFPDVDTIIAELHPQPNVKCFAVMRLYRPSEYPPLRCAGGPGGNQLAVITVLSEDMGGKNFERGNWRVPSYAPGPSTTEKPTLSTKPFAASLKDVKPAPPQAKPTGVVVPIKPGAVAPARSTNTGIKRPPGSMTREGRKEREEFVRTVLRKRPFINYHGEDGIEPLLQKTYGIGVEMKIFKRIREEIQAELRPVIGDRTPAGKRGGNQAAARFELNDTGTIMQGAAPAPIPAPPPPIVTAPAADVFAMGMQFAQAMQDERTAKAALDEAETAVGRAREAYEKAVADRMALFKKMGGG